MGGLLLGLQNVLGSIQFSNLGGKTIVEVSKFWEGVNEIVSVISGAIFGFLPVGITWSVSRKMGTSQILGIVLGICLVHPSLLSAYEYAAHKAAGDVPHFILGFEKLVTKDKLFQHSWLV